jgi:hypothetical protein
MDISQRRHTNGIGKEFLNRSSTAQEIKEDLANGVYQIKNHLHSKRNNQQSKETAYRMVENLCQISSSIELISRIFKNSEN